MHKSLCYDYVRRHQWVLAFKIATGYYEAKGYHYGRARQLARRYVQYCVFVLAPTSIS